MPYIFGKLWHLAIIWAIRKAFQCILQGVRFLLANHTRLSPTPENDSYTDPWMWFKSCRHPISNNSIFWRNPAEPPATANIYSFLITFNIHTLLDSICPTQPIFTNTELEMLSIRYVWVYLHLIFMPRLTFWHPVSQQFVCVFFVANLSQKEGGGHFESKNLYCRFRKF